MSGPYPVAAVGACPSAKDKSFLVIQACRLRKPKDMDEVFRKSRRFIGLLKGNSYKRGN